MSDNSKFVDIKEAKEIILNLYNHGISIVAISRYTDISEASLRNILHGRCKVTAIKNITTLRNIDINELLKFQQENKIRYRGPSLPKNQSSITRKVTRSTNIPSKNITHLPSIPSTRYHIDQNATREHYSTHKIPIIFTTKDYPSPYQIISYLVESGVTYLQISSVMETTAGNILAIARGNCSNIALYRQIDNRRAELENLLPK